MVTVRAIWPGMAASTARSSSTKPTRIAIGKSQLGRTDFTHGEFGENFTVEGMSDDEVCIGDHYRIGGRIVRSDATARHLLPDRHSHERAANGGAAGLARQARLLLSVSSRREKSRPATRSCESCKDRKAMTVADVNALLYEARSSGGPVGAGIAHSGAEHRLEAVRSRRCWNRRKVRWRDGRQSRVLGRAAGPLNRHGRGSAHCACRARFARAAVSPRCCSNPADGRPSGGRSARPVCRAAPAPDARCTAVAAQLLALRRAQRHSAIASASSAMPAAWQGHISPTSCRRWARSSRRPRRGAALR